MECMNEVNKLRVTLNKELDLAEATIRHYFE
jgi:hypothetical protein